MKMIKAVDCNRFQHTAARRRLGGSIDTPSLILEVSTHSRPKAAGKILSDNKRYETVSTHSRPKAAGDKKGSAIPLSLFQHTAARRRLGFCLLSVELSSKFQHTAARRRLVKGAWKLEEM